MCEESLVKLNSALEYINEVCRNGDLNRRGTLFSTTLNNYFYDTGTGKVILLDELSYQIMKNWFSGDLEAVKELTDKNESYVNQALELLEVIESEHLLQAKKPEKLYSTGHFETFDFDIDNKREQLILELTGKCNLRCGYCIYNDEYVHARAFNSEDMSFETAKKAVDDFFDHADHEMSITFYGGEPLIKFELLKEIIEYSLALNQSYQKELSFSLTTNATLVTEEIADYLASVKDLSLLCSIDGPEDVHDAYRKDVNGMGSFARALAGTEKLANSFSKQGKKISINAVFGPPYTYERLESIENFFKGLTFLSADTTIGFGYPSEGSITGPNYSELIVNNEKYKNALFSDLNPLWDWRRDKINSASNLQFANATIVTSDMDKEFAYIDNRIVTSEPNTLFPMNGCCVPGKRRLYVDTKGVYYPCERMGNCPDIGSVEAGLNLDKIKKHYIEDYAEKSIEKCSSCWAVKLCSLCYANRYDEDGFIGSEMACQGTRNMLVRALSQYHELREGNLEKIAHFSETIIV